MSLHPVSKMIRTRVEQTNEMEHSSPIFLTSSFSFDNSEDMRAAFADETAGFPIPRYRNLLTGCAYSKAWNQVLPRLQV
jgi:O-succinylhomoserine sulfhydrylase